MKKTLSLVLTTLLLIACQPQQKDNTPPAENPAEVMDDLLVYYIALEGADEVGEPIGCDDSVVPVTITVPQTSAPLKTALEHLLAEKNQNVEEDLYNSLYQSNLKVDSTTILNGQAEVKLSGTTQLGGTCDIPRFEAQIIKTVLQFPEITEAKIFLNGKKLEEALSQK